MECEENVITGLNLTLKTGNSRVVYCLTFYTMKSLPARKHSPWGSPGFNPGTPVLYNILK
jgi:hypothetical protein